jgi:hypothetical protein
MNHHAWLPPKLEEYSTFSTPSHFIEKPREVVCTQSIQKLFRLLSNLASQKTCDVCLDAGKGKRGSRHGRSPQTICSEASYSESQVLGSICPVGNTLEL